MICKTRVSIVFVIFFAVDARRGIAEKGGQSMVQPPLLHPRSMACQSCVISTVGTAGDVGPFLTKLYFLRCRHLILLFGGRFVDLHPHSATSLEDFSVYDERAPAHVENCTESALVEDFEETQLLLIYDPRLGTILEREQHDGYIDLNSCAFS